MEVLGIGVVCFANRRSQGVQRFTVYYIDVRRTYVFYMYYAVPYYADLTADLASILTTIFMRPY